MPKNFEELAIWQLARRVTCDIYSFGRTTALSRDYGLRDQMQRAAVSVMSNIAEGFERGGNQEFIQFLYIAKSSSGELRSQIYVALDQRYVSSTEAEKILITLKHLSVMIKRLVDHLKQSNFRGPKYMKSGLRNQLKRPETVESEPLKP